MGFATFRRGWCLCELGVTKARWVIYSVEDGLVEQVDDIIAVLSKSENVASEKTRFLALEEMLGFEAAAFSVESDRAIVRTLIETAHRSVKHFDAFLLKKVTTDTHLTEATEKIEEARRKRRCCLLWVCFYFFGCVFFTGDLLGRCCVSRGRARS